MQNRLAASVVCGVSILVLAVCADARPAVGDGLFTPNLDTGVLDAAASSAEPGRVAPSLKVLRIGGIANHVEGWQTERTGEPTEARYTIAFREPTRVGTVMAYGRWKVSYLAPGARLTGPGGGRWVEARYAGDPARLIRAVALPRDVRTRAVRLSGTPRTDSSGTFGSLLTMATTFQGRFVNVAPLADVSISSSGPKDTGFQPDARKNNPASILDGIVGGRNWASGDRASPVSAGEPEWVVLSWPAPRRVRGCAAFVVGSGFGRMQVQRFTGRGEPDGTDDDAWETVGTMEGRRPWRPYFWEVYCDFGRDVETSALRFLATQGMTKDRAARGEGADPNRITLGELMVFEDLGSRPAPVKVVKKKRIPDGVVPITFEMPQAGKATIQITDDAGAVVRNLVTGAEFPAGRTTVWWDLGTIEDYWEPYEPPRQYAFDAPAGWRRIATPGTYRWHGLWHPGLSLSYLYSYYPLKKHGMAWTTADTTGGWLGDHEPPRTVVRTGETMWVGTFCEAGQAMLESDLDMRKLWGSNRIWLACPQVMAVDGDHVFFAAQGGWVGENVVMIQIDRKTKRSRRIMRHGYEQPKDGPQPWDIRGLAVKGARAYVSNRGEGELVVLDISRNLAGPWRGFGWGEVGKTFDDEKMTVVKRIDLEKPGRVRPYDESRLAVVSGTRVVLVDTETYEVETLVSGLVNPMGLAVDEDRTVYVGELEPVHQVKVFSPRGRLTRTIGRRGPHRVGTFDMHNLESPAGVEVDADGNVWVCEHNEHLKRTSVWDRRGRCVSQVLGPTQYGGGGCIDPDDANRFFYQGKEFRRDERTGRIRLVNIMWRGDDQTFDNFYSHAGHNFGGAAPSYAFRTGGRLFFTSWQGWGAGQRTALFVYDRGRARPVAAVGVPPEWLWDRMGKAQPDPRFGRVVHTRVDERVDFTWGGAPAKGVKADDFAVRWTGVVEAPREGAYRFRTTSDDGVRLFVGGKKVLENWTDHGPTEDAGGIHLTAGRHDLTLEFYEKSGGACVRLEWEGPGVGREVVPRSALKTSRAADAAPGLTARFYHGGRAECIFAWTDGNDDGRVQPAEVQLGGLALGETPWDKIGATWQFRMNERFEVAASDGGYDAAGIAFFRVKQVTRRGYPVYELPTEVKPIPGLRHASDAVFTDARGNAISLDEFITSMRPDGTVNWRYKNRWPGLHAGHHTTAGGDEPGVVIAPTRFFGSARVNDEVGEVISFNSNLGATYLITADGLYVDRVFKDTRRGLSWRMNAPPPDAVMNMVSIGDEHFGGTFQRVRGQDGKHRFLYVVGQPHCSVVELRGLESLKRIRGGRIRVTARHLADAERLRRQRARAKSGPKRYVIPRARGVKIDGRADEWAKERIDGFALSYDSANLYVLFEGADDRAVFQNAAGEDSFLEAFKTGDVVDVKLATQPGGDLKRDAAARGDIRLSFAMVGGRPEAILYDFVVPGTPRGARNSFSSPWRTVYIDRVTILRDTRVAVERAGERYVLEAAVPLRSIHLDPGRTPQIKGDVGRVLSDQTGTRAVARVYWSNKSTNIVSDVPSEASIHPGSWGTFRFKESH